LLELVFVVPFTGSTVARSGTLDAPAEQTDRSAAWWQRRYLLSSIVTACIGLSLSIGAWYAVSFREVRLAELELRSRATNHALLLESGIKQYIGKVAALRALFESDDHVTRAEFQIFAESILRDQTAMLAVSWLPRVTREQRAAHELDAVSQGLTGYRIKSPGPDGSLPPAADQPEHFPVFFTSGESPGSPLYGLDLNDGGVRQQALESARDGDRIAVSGNFLLRAGAGDRNGFFVVMQVYRLGLPHDTLQSRRDNLIGFVQGVFQIGVLIETILATTSTPGGLDLYFYASGPRSDARPIYFHPSRARKGPIATAPRKALDTRPHWSDAISVGDRQWTFVAAGIPGGPGTPNHLGSWIVLATALFITALVTAYIWSLGRHAQRIDEQNVRFDMALTNMSQGLLLFDPSGRLVMHNRRYGEMYGLSPQVIKPGCTIRDLLERRRDSAAFEDDPDTYVKDLMSTIRQGRPFERLTRLPDGRTIAVVNHPVPGGGWVATHEDITERLRAEARIAYMARHDALTDLPNRVLFHDRLDHALKHARDEKLAVLCLDIDHFKDVNDTLGHPVGDLLLQAVAERLRRSIRESDTVARLGGDEFAVVQVGASQPTDATRLATRLIEAINAPYDLDGHHVVVGMSIGIAIPPDDGTDPHQLLKNADMALYRAKSDGRGVFRFFEAEMDARMQARRTLELDLRKAVVNGEFELYYQPLIDVRSRYVHGFEALIRWHHPDRGLVSPADFIPLAEETGLIVPIGEWVLRQACKEATTWPDDVSVAINLSPVQFKSRQLLPTVISALAASGLPASRLELEITESLLLQESEDTLAMLHQLRSLGIRISMDDFGTGYSSLGYLQKFPFDKIKIDRSFVHDMTDRDDSLAIVRAVAAMGASLGMKTTAEGVETIEQFDQLKAEGCTEVQGYLFGAPRPASEVRGLLQKFNPKLKAIA
jgi:diguanylate cyclase (GGDEF)-like protein